MLLTKVDHLAEMAKKTTSLDSIARALKTSPEIIDFIARALEKDGIISIGYPAIGGSTLTLAKPLPIVEDKIPTECDEKVEFSSWNIPVSVYIYQDAERRPFYHVITPVLGPYTQAFLETIKSDIAKEIPFEAHYFLTPERVQTYLPEVRDKIRERIAKYFEGDDLEVITGLTFISMYGMGDLDILLQDEALEEVAVNTSTLPVAVYHKKYGWMKTNLFIGDEEAIANIAAQIARRVGEQITISNPILDAYLTTGDRACATLYPASTKGNTITIRKFVRDPWTSIKFIDGHTISADMIAFLWQATHYESNIIVTGGTASGKTSMLNTLTHFVPPFQRVVTIEETRELMLPHHIWNWIPLLTRTMGPEGKGEISMATLLTASLRLRPDRMILGEVRTREEAEVLFDAMHTGHSVATTFHADTASQLIRRMLEPPFNLPPTEVSSINLIVVQHRDRRRNFRRTFEISELVTGVEGKVITNRIFLWRPRLDKFEQVNTPRRYIEDINLYTGMTEREILEDLGQRKEIIEWMDRKGYSNIVDVGEVMRMYYNFPEELLELVEGDKKLK